MKTDSTIRDDSLPPAGGWGSAKAVVGIFIQEQAIGKAGAAMLRQNKPDGFACVSCSWAKPAHPHSIEACENGLKATAWELTGKRATPQLLARHTLAELEAWKDLDLEDMGRLTHPLRWDPGSDTYQPIAWESALSEIGAQLRELDPASVVFYASGRASLETSYMYQLMARLYGTNNLPDSSNMCHESTSVALPQSIGVPIGTVSLDDFTETDCIFFFGQNPGTNSPRMLHQLQDARRSRDIRIVTFNPLREPGLIDFVNPLSPGQMLSGHATPISTQYNQVKIGGDIAALTGMCKAVIASDDSARAAGRESILDRDFIEEHTHGFEAFVEFVRGSDWTAIETESGLSRQALEAAADTYVQNPNIDWDAWVGDYSLVREAIERTFPDIFHDFNQRMWTPGGFRRPVPAAERKWRIQTGKANFIVPESLEEDPDMPVSAADVLRLMTIRSDDQFNTTVYSENDRFRLVVGTRRVLLMNARDILRLGLRANELVTACSVAADSKERCVSGLRVLPFDIPAGCVAGYYPECNPLIPLWHHAKGSKVPAAKSVPIRILARAAP